MSGRTDDPAIQQLPRRAKVLYVATTSWHGLTFVKVGITGSPQERLNHIKTYCPFPIEKFLYLPTEDEYLAARIEKNLHRIYANKHTNGEWFFLEDKEDIYWFFTTFMEITEAAGMSSAVTLL